MSKKGLHDRLSLPQFPRSAKYDIGWLNKNEMGPCSIWLAEFLAEQMPIVPETRVLDLGCGRAMSSIFLAKEFGARVWATDLWIDASENLGRIEEAGVGERVYPIHAEAHSLPFAKGFFDAIVSLDAYHYFGTAEMYFAYICSFLKPGGRIGIVVPGAKRELTEEDARRLGRLWEDDFYTFHTAEWWKTLWGHSRIAQVEVADEMPEGHGVWLRWDKELRDAGDLKRHGDVEVLESDGGNLTLVRVVARKSEKAP
jgi:cyclopropane fatty-acyl-phospholipid synthase-like methyltransferase